MEVLFDRQQNHLHTSEGSLFMTNTKTNLLARVIGFGMFLMMLATMLLTPVSASAASVPGYGGAPCVVGAGKVRVANKCVCDPNSSNYNICKDSDKKDTLCTANLYRLDKQCVRLVVLDKINDVFWEVYNRGFWPSYRP